MTAVSLKNELAKVSSLEEALAVIASTGGSSSTGVLRVLSDVVTGRIGIVKGVLVVSAVIPLSGDTGEIALEKLLAVRRGIFQFLETNDENAVYCGQNLAMDLEDVQNQARKAASSTLSLLETIKALTAAKEATQDPITSNPEYQRMINDPHTDPRDIERLRDRLMFEQQMPGFEDRMDERSSDMRGKQLQDQRNAEIDQMIQWFMSQHPALTALPELNSEQLQNLRTMFAGLKTDDERTSFLEKNPSFTDAMSFSFRDRQREMILKFTEEKIKENPEKYLEWQLSIMGADHAPISGSQADVLRSMYASFVSDSDRQDFLRSNPSFADELPVEKNFFLPPEEEAPPPVDVFAQALQRDEPERAPVERSEFAEGAQDAERTARLRGKLGVQAERQGPTNFFVKIFRPNEEQYSEELDLLSSEQSQNRYRFEAVAVALLFIGFGIFAWIRWREYEATKARYAEMAAAIEEASRKDAPVVRSAYKMVEAPPNVFGKAVNNQSAPTESTSLYWQEEVDESPFGLKKTEGDKLLRSGHLEEALKAYLECLRMKPDNFKVRVLVIRIYITLGNNNEARKQCQMALGLCKNKNEKNVINSLLQWMDGYNVGHPQLPAKQPQSQ